MTKRLTSPNPTPTIERNQVASGLGIGISNNMIYEDSNAGKGLTDYINKQAPKQMAERGASIGF